MKLVWVVFRQKAIHISKGFLMTLGVLTSYLMILLRKSFFLEWMNGWKTCSWSKGNDYYWNQQFTASLITVRESNHYYGCQPITSLAWESFLQGGKTDSAIRVRSHFHWRVPIKIVIEKITKISYKKIVSSFSLTRRNQEDDDDKSL